MLVLVVTGGIGSGKSEVCKILSGKGLKVQYNADAKAKALYSSHPELVSVLEKSLECRLRDADDVFVPSLLASRIFSDKEALQTVESVVFPALLADFRDFQKANQECDTIVFESATILDKPYFEGFGDRILLVDAPVQKRLERASQRDGADYETIRARMDNQKYINSLSEGNADPRIDAVIINDGSLQELEKKIEELLPLLQSPR